MASSRTTRTRRRAMALAATALAALAAGCSYGETEEVGLVSVPGSETSVGATSVSTAPAATAATTAAPPSTAAPARPKAAPSTSTGPTTTLDRFGLPPASTPQEATATRMIERTASRDFAGAVVDFDTSMRRQLPADELARVWQDLEAQGGQFQRLSGRVSGPSPPSTIVQFYVHFARVTRTVHVTVGPSDQIVGFQILE